MKSLINLYKNLKFVRKIQFGFLLLGMISTLIALNDFIQMRNFDDSKDSIFEEYVTPRENIGKIYSEFRNIQFIMLKFSMPEFADNFQNNIQEFQSNKDELDSSLAILKSKDFSEETLKSIDEIEAIWGNYKNVVADAVVSAAVTQDFEMAAIITTTSGEEVGNQLVTKFDSIIEELDHKAEAMNKSISSDISSSKFIIIIGMVIGAIIFMICAFIIAPTITKPIRLFKVKLQEFAAGNYEDEVKVDSKDEIGELGIMMNELRNAQLEKINAAEKIAQGSLEKVHPASAEDMLAHSFNKEVDTIDLLLSEAEKLIEANKRGDLSLRGEVDKFEGGWKKIIEGINSILDAIKTPINEAGDVLKTVAAGDLRKRMVGNYNGDYEEIKNNVNLVVDSFNNLIGSVSGSSSELAKSASMISSSTEEMAAGAIEQSSQASEVQNSVEEMSKSIVDSSQNASNAALSAREARDSAMNGGDVVEKTILSINDIANVVVESAETMQALGKSSNEIGEIIKVINDIADQTNLLALNAAIEAARAGEQGRGFAVVADEVRKLAERTTKATDEIATMIKQIQQDTSDAVESIGQGTEKVAQGKELAQEAGSALGEIIANSDQISDLIGQLASASEEQSTSSEVISNNVDAISQVTQQSAQSTEQIRNSAEGLYQLTENLQQVIDQFKLDSDNIDNPGNSDFSVRTNGKIVTS